LGFIVFIAGQDSKTVLLLGGALSIRQTLHTPVDIAHGNPAVLAVDFSQAIARAGIASARQVQG